MQNAPPQYWDEKINQYIFPFSNVARFSAGFTLDTYTHVNISAWKEAADTIGNVLSM